MKKIKICAAALVMASLIAGFMLHNTSILNRKKLFNTAEEYASLGYLDLKTFQRYKTFDEENSKIIFAGAPNLFYRCYNYDNRKINRCDGDDFKTMLDLKYDLDVAENKCDWTAKEIIARELLKIIDENYGSPKVKFKSNKEVQKMIDFQNMAALHGAMAILQVATQRKTTEICRSHIKLNVSDLCKVYTANRESFDRHFEDYVKGANLSEFEMNNSMGKYNNTSLNDIVELAKILSNPLVTKVITLNISGKCYRRFRIFTENSQECRSLYKKAVRNGTKLIFNFSDKEFLRKITVDYFMKIYDKMEHFIAYYPKVKLKLRDCNGGDIFGNRDVCSYNSTLELIRREPANRSFIAAGGMFDSSKISEIMNSSNENNFKTYLWIPFKHFREDGQCDYNFDEEKNKILQDENELEQKMNYIKEYERKAESLLGQAHTRPNPRGKCWAVDYNGHKFFISKKNLKLLMI